ncbi:hypothetical protein CEXT_321601 [Caerostris extrusa]|uniref:Uncharacterized protein n=1 Tax=Caerostris extrusa TaxID=172846 RepID=A0AAV4MDR4_CAEEX|nr:hypothetical protein CEXT_321601 [Caerostris extrusa]
MALRELSCVVRARFQVAPHLVPTPGPVRRSTVQRTAAADHSETKSTRDITLSRSESYQLTTRPTVATPVTVGVERENYLDHSITSRNSTITNAIAQAISWRKASKHEIR